MKKPAELYDECLDQIKRALMNARHLNLDAHVDLLREVETIIGIEKTDIKEYHTIKPERSY